MILKLILGLIGFSATVAQILLLRELLVVYYGNEISLGIILANWLLWIAFGSSVLGRIALRTGRLELLLSILQLLSALALPSAILAARMVRILFDTVPGELVSPGMMFVSSLLVLAGFCSISGAMFAVGSRLYSKLAETSTAEATSSVYLLEAVGAGIGGVLISLILIQTLSSFEIAFTISLCNFAAACALTYRHLFTRVLFWFGLGTAAFLILGLVAPELETRSQQLFWGELDLVESRNSRFGNLTVTQALGSRTLYVNGLVSFTFPDPESAEESVHLALLQHPRPQRLLLIGGGLNGSLQNALQHKTLEQIDFVELDPEMFELSRRFFADNYRPLSNEPRVRFHMTDGRLFLRRTRTKYDVIIVGLPDPKTAQINRFYTREFYQEAARKLRPDGLLSFQVSGAENYVSDELAAFLACLRRTLREVFADVVVFPGGRIHFFAALRQGSLSTQSKILIRRLQSRRIKTQYIREYTLPFRLMPDRLLDLEHQLDRQSDGRINTDFSPVAYYFDMLFWSTRFNHGFLRLMKWINLLRFEQVLLFVLGTSLLAALSQFFRRDSTRLPRRAAGYCVWGTGFTSLALEMILLLGFQAVYGYVFYRLSLIVATFMAGIAAGSAWSLRRRQEVETQSQTRLLFRLQLVAAVSALLVCGVLFVLAGTASQIPVFLVSGFLFPFLALLAGTLGGFQFPLASGLFFDSKENDKASPGLVYGLDILGACSASLLLSVVFFPLYGLFQSGVLIAAINLGPVLLAGLAMRNAEKWKF